MNITDDFLKELDEVIEEFTIKIDNLEVEMIDEFIEEDGNICKE